MSQWATCFHCRLTESPVSPALTEPQLWLSGWVRPMQSGDLSQSRPKWEGTWMRRGTLWIILGWKPCRLLFQVRKNLIQEEPGTQNGHTALCSTHLILTGTLYKVEVITVITSKTWEAGLCSTHNGCKVIQLASRCAVRKPEYEIRTWETDSACNDFLSYYKSHQFTV